MQRTPAVRAVGLYRRRRGPRAGEERSAAHGPAGKR